MVSDTHGHPPKHEEGRQTQTQIVHENVNVENKHGTQKPCAKIDVIQLLTLRVDCNYNTNTHTPTHTDTLFPLT